MPKKDNQVSVITIIGLIEDEGPAFGAVVSTGEKVFISARMRRATNPQHGDDWKALLTANRVEPEKTPWFCRQLIRLQEDVVEEL